LPLLLSRHPFADSTFGVWHITEEEAYFQKGVEITPEEAKDVSTLKELRHTEWWAVRWLLHRLTGVEKRIPLAKTAFSKPFFLDHPDLFCSLSHSQGIIGALVSDVNCGCDLQVFVEKMRRIAPRFLHEKEKKWIETFDLAVQMDLMHLFWTMKEALYKTYGLKELDFKKHIHIPPFEWDGLGNTAPGFIEKDGFSGAYHLFFGKNYLPAAVEEMDTNTPGQAYFWTVCTEKK
jgi:4'-phosphopantetheinyl transferase